MLGRFPPVTALFCSTERDAIEEWQRKVIVCVRQRNPHIRNSLHPSRTACDHICVTAIQAAKSIHKSVH